MLCARVLHRSAARDHSLSTPTGIGSEVTRISCLFSSLAPRCASIGTPDHFRARSRLDDAHGLVGEVHAADCGGAVLVGFSCSVSNSQPTIHIRTTFLFPRHELAMASPAMQALRRASSSLHRCTALHRHGAAVRPALSAVCLAARLSPRNPATLAYCPRTSSFFTRSEKSDRKRPLAEDIKITSYFRLSCCYRLHWMRPRRMARF